MPGVCGVFVSSSSAWTMRTPCSRQSVMGTSSRRRRGESVALLEQAREARLSQVDVPLELSQHFVADASLVAEPQRGFALDAEKLMRQLVIPILRGAGFVLPVAGRQAVESTAVMLLQIVVDAAESGIVLLARVR